MMLTMMLAAISVAYAPSSTNEYYFAKPPADAFVSYSHQSAFPLRDYNNTAYKLPLDTPGIRYMGAWRRCPITGDPFGGLYKHEAIAWINEALAEREFIVSSFSNLPLRDDGWCNDMFFGKSVYTISPDFGFTNNCCIANPTPGAGSIVVVNTNATINGDFLRAHFGGNNGHPSIGFIAPINATAGHPIKMSHLEPVVNALKGFDTAAVRTDTFSGAVSNIIEETVTENVGNWVYFKWENVTCTPEVRQYIPTITTTTNNVGTLACWAYTDEKSRNFYLSNWSDSENKFMSLAEAPSTGVHHTTEDSFIGQEGFSVYFHVSTNGMIAGGFNRMDSVSLFHKINVKHKVTRGVDTELNIENDVIIPDTGTISPYGDHFVISPSKSFRNMIPQAFSACGLTWKEAPTADTPDEIKYSDISEEAKHHAGNWTSPSSRRIYQSCDYSGTYILYNVKFRMK